MSVSLGELAVRFGCELRGDPDRRVGHVATLANADERSLAFLANPHYRQQLAATRAADVRLTARVTLGPRVSVGARSVLQPGVVIGGDGFGFAPEHGAWLKVPQLGTVRIGDDVEIGANTTIDRGAIDDTVIEE